MNKKKGISPSVLIFITLVLTSLFPFAYASGAKGSEVSYFKEYADIDKLVKSVSYDIVIPDYVLDYCKGNEVHAENIMGQVIQIDCQEFAFKASYFMDDNADILGLYERADIDNKYSVTSNNNGIHYFRFRTGYKDYPNTTLINWNTDETTHGIMLANIITEDEALSLIGLSREDIKDYTSENIELDAEVETTNILVNTYVVGDGIEISLPEFDKEVSVIDNSTFASFYVDSKLLFILEYSGIDSEIDASYSVYNADNICIKYMDIEDENDNNYTLFKNNILDIKDSIKILE